MPLSDINCKTAKPKDKPYKLSDEKGMFLLVHPNGSKYFRMNYRFEGKGKTIALGVYPDVSLKDARDKVAEVRKQLSAGIDPSEHRQAVKAARHKALANSFEVIALEWLAKKCEDHSDRPMRLLNNLLPYLGQKAITDIKPKHILDCARRVEESNLEAAHRTIRIASQVFRYAVATDRAELDPTPSLRGALPAIKASHFAAITDPVKFGAVLRAIDGYDGTFPVQCALRVAPLVFVRPGELRSAKWEDFDLDTKEWRYRVNKTKTDFIVPLSDQVIAILQDLLPHTGHTPYLFPSERTPKGDRCMSENALSAALKRLGYSSGELSVHGFRATARTLLEEELKYDIGIVEMQLAHNVRDTLGRAYNRTTHLATRHKMMQAWADYLDKLKLGADIVPLFKTN